jgi:hypothetical protein
MWTQHNCNNIIFGTPVNRSKVYFSMLAALTILINLYKHFLGERLLRPTGLAKTLKPHFSVFTCAASAPTVEGVGTWSGSTAKAIGLCKQCNVILNMRNFEHILNTMLYNLACLIAISRQKVLVLTIPMYTGVRERT